LSCSFVAEAWTKLLIHRRSDTLDTLAHLSSGRYGYIDGVYVDTIEYAIREAEIAAQGGHYDTSSFGIPDGEYNGGQSSTSGRGDNDSDDRRANHVTSRTTTSDPVHETTTTTNTYSNGSSTRTTVDNRGNGTHTVSHSNGSESTYTQSNYGADMPVVLDLDGDGIEISFEFSASFDFPPIGDKPPASSRSASANLLMIFSPEF